MFCANDLFARGRLVFLDDVAFKIGDAQDRDRRNLHAFVGEDRVGGGHVEQTHFAAAQRERETIIRLGQ